jgi:hypothetical protein
MMLMKIVGYQLLFRDIILVIISEIHGTALFGLVITVKILDKLGNGQAVNPRHMREFGG